MSKPRSSLRALRGWAKASLSNALELARLGRLTPRDDSRFVVVDQHPSARLRRYGDPARATSAPILLIPPLMLTAEIYDVAPELSAVHRLAAEAIDVWVVDFGAPEQEEGGMARTLDDHVRAVAWAIERVHRETGRPVHLGGYSQGGMFAYQAAAFVDAAQVASVVTFGSPVDIHRNVPQLGSDVAAHLIRGLEPLVRVPLDRIEGLPGELTSLGFRLLTPRKELSQLVDFLLKLHDRSALEKRESRRRFLGGEGFVAWPGPALVKFFEEFIVHNRLVSGGLVIDGRTLSLADIRCPVLTFVGARDDFARPPSIRAIRTVAPHAEVHEIVLAAGHFGLVVGSTSLRDTWPSVAEWVRWQDGQGPEPRLLVAQRPEPRHHDEVEEYFDVDFDYEMLGDELLGAVRTAWSRLGEMVRDTGDTVYSLRHQLPRVWQLETMTADTRISASQILREQAARAPGDTFFLWRGRAFTYGEAEQRVENVARGLLEVGVAVGERVAVLMGVRPTYLSLVTAAIRVGAVPVLISPELDDGALREALASLEVRRVIADPERAERARALGLETLVLGGGPDRAVPAGTRDMEAIDPAVVEWPPGRAADAGRAGELGMVLLRPGPGGQAKVARISHGRWAFSALGVSSGTTLAPEDTVYCCLPLHHPTGIMVAVGGALVAGARLALAPAFEAATFWPEVRRYGVTVVFYAGEMARLLVDAPPSRGDRSHPVRLFAGSGMRADVWLRLRERFGVGVTEFYASTERHLVLTNAAGQKIGALGRPLPGSAELAIVAYDWDAGDFLRQENGHLRRADALEAGIALARLEPDAPVLAGSAVVEGAFEPGDRWAITHDVLQRDADGDYWFVDRLAHMVTTPDGPVSTHRVEDALYGAGARLAVAFAVDGEVHAQVVSEGALDAERWTRVLSATLDPQARPTVVERVAGLATTEGMRPIKTGRGEAVVVQRLRWQEGAGYREEARSP